ncbi:MAG: LysR family transcriptional regulator, partial [Proteobacteria bacterium]
MVELESTRVFVKVIESGSFTKAADLLRIPKSNVSRAVGRLESETGTKLITRTTRSLTLTAAGRAFYDSCRGPILTLEQARLSLDGRDSIVAGLVRVTAPEDLGNLVLAPTLAELSRKHPALSFQFQYTDQVVDLVREGYDLAIRLGKLRDSSMKAKKLGAIRLVLVASPKYLKDMPAISNPEHLMQHRCLTYAGSQSREWILRSRKSTAHVAIAATVQG